MGKTGYLYKKLPSDTVKVKPVTEGKRGGGGGGRKSKQPFGVGQRTGWAGGGERKGQRSPTAGKVMPKSPRQTAERGRAASHRIRGKQKIKIGPI